MSTTTPAPIAAAARDGFAPPPPSGRAPAARLVAPVGLVLGALMFAVGSWLHLPAMPQDVGITQAIAEAPSRWMASHLFLSAGLVLVAVAAMSALPLVHGRGRIPTAAGVVLMSLGAVVLGLSDMAHGAVGFALAGPVDPATSFDVHNAYFEQPVILGLNTGPLFLTVGMITLGIGLLRSHGVPRWQGVVVLLAPFGVHAALNLEAPTYVHGVPFVIGLTVLALVVAGVPRPAGARPPALDG